MNLKNICAFSNIRAVRLPREFCKQESDFIKDEIKDFNLMKMSQDEPQTTIDALYEEILLEVFEFLDASNLKSCAQVCKL